MAMLRFRSAVRIQGINPYISVSAARAAALKPGWRKPMPVQVRINGAPKVPWRINMMPVGNGGFYLYLHGDVRKASGTKVGEKVAVEVRFDAAYRGGPMHPMPSWFRAALAKNQKARKAWAGLIPSRKKELLRYFFRLKSREARSRNLARAVQVLSGKGGRFMGRSWQRSAAARK